MKQKWWVILAVAGVFGAGWLLLGQPDRVLYRLEVPFARPIGFAPDGRLAVLTSTELLMIDAGGQSEKISSQVSLGQAAESQVTDGDGFTVTAGQNGVIRRFNWQGDPLWTFAAPALDQQPGDPGLARDQWPGRGRGRARRAGEWHRRIGGARP